MCYISSRDYSKKGLTLGLKENVEALKQELSTEEQFLESVIKAEGFFKKYKKLLIGAAIAVVLAVAAYLTMDYIKNRDLQMANKALAVLQQNPEDQKALAQLKDKNPSLYALFAFSQAVKSGDAQKITEVQKTLKDPVLKDLASFQSASLTENAQQLGAYGQKQEALLKELAILDEAFLLFQKGENEKAREVLKKISPTSGLFQIVQNFMHYQK